MLPKGTVEIVPATEIKVGETEGVRGLYLQRGASGQGSKALILYTLEGRDDPRPLSRVDVTVKHEGFHHLWDMDFIRSQEKEWFLKKAKEGDWLNQYSDFYQKKFKDVYEEGVYEARDKAWAEENIAIEALIHEYEKWLVKPDAAHPQAGLFQRIKAFFEELAEQIKELFGKEPSLERLFQRIESGEVGRRRPEGEDITRFSEFGEDEMELSSAGKISGRPMPREVMPKPEPRTFEEAFGEDLPKAAPGVRRLADEAPKAAMAPPPETPKPGDFYADPKSLGMNKDEFRRWSELLEERNKADIERRMTKEAREAKRRQSSEWKENEVMTREEVENGVLGSPEVTLLALIRNGESGNIKLPYRLKLDEDALTPEQKAVMPKDYYRKGGEDVGALAELLGFGSKEALVASLVALEQERGVRKFENFIRAKVDEQTAALMERRYGVLKENIIQEAREHVISDIQNEMLFVELQAATRRAGMDPGKTTFADAKQWAEDRFGEYVANKADLAKFVTQIMRAARKETLGHLKDKPREAFQQAQIKFGASLLAEEAKKFAKEQDRAERLFKKYNKAEPVGVEPEFRTWAQKLLKLAEMPVGRLDMGQLDRANELHGYRSFDHFIGQRLNEMIDMDAPDWIRLEQIMPLEKMTVKEYREFAEAVKTLDVIGREAMKIEVGGRKVDWADWAEEVKANLKELPIVTEKQQKKLIHSMIDATHVRIEEIVRDLDLRRELGPLFQALIVPMMGKKTEYTGKHGYNLFEEELTAKLRDLKKEMGGGRFLSGKWIKSLDDPIPNDFLWDPHDQKNFEMTRGNMINIMLNWGTNRKNFTLGYADKDAAKAQALEARLFRMFQEHSTKEDWKFVEGIWSVFKSWRGPIEALEHDIKGNVPKRIAAQPFELTLANGDVVKVSGEYYPIFYDRLRSDISTVEFSKQNLWGGQNYIKATTSQGYLRDRTGYVDRIEFNRGAENAVGRMQQTIHDLAYRKPVLQAQKIFKDKEIMALIRQHYGQAYEDALKTWVKDIATHFNQDEVRLQGLMEFMRKARFNLTVNALGINLRVLGSPDVGMADPRSWGGTLSRSLSKPLRRVLNPDYQSDVDLAWAESKEIPHTFKNMDRDYREGMEALLNKKGFKGLEKTAARWSFIPLMKVSQGFRVATFATKFKEKLAEGYDREEASNIADMYVRQRHGSSGLPDLPAIMRGSEPMKMLTMFYGWFNTMYNWQRTVPGHARRGEYKDMMGAIWGSVIVGSLFGMLLFNKRYEDEPIWETFSKAIVLQEAGNLVIGRDMANLMIEGRRPSTPLGSIMEMIKQLTTDGYRIYMGKQAKKPIQHAANVAGMMRGLPGAQIGRTAQFLHDVREGKQDPGDFFGWMRGIISGDSKVPKRKNWLW